MFAADTDLYVYVAAGDIKNWAAGHMNNRSGFDGHSLFLPAQRFERGKGRGTDKIDIRGTSDGRCRATPDFPEH